MRPGLSCRQRDGFRIEGWLDMRQVRLLVMPDAIRHPCLHTRNFSASAI